MPGLVPGIHVFKSAGETRTAGTSPAMMPKGITFPVSGLGPY